MQVITSKNNEIIKNIRKLKEKKYRDLENKFIVEGIKIVLEAIIEKADIDLIVICEENNIEKSKLELLKKYNYIYVSNKVFSAITDLKSPQGVIAIINKKIDNKVKTNEDLIVVLDGIQDPGNLGTILRTIDSVGISQVIVSKETADSFNSKVVRSTMGAIFRVNIITVDNLINTLKDLKNSGYEVLATSLENSKSIYDIDYTKKVIVIGNEGNGVSKEVLKEADLKIHIPMLGKTESLNAAIATGVVLYEYVRQHLK